MNRNKRVVSCPNFLQRCNRRPDSELNNNASILKKIDSQYAGYVPRILGHPVRLGNLFTAVVSRGGYRAVCEQRLWADIARELDLPTACTNCSIGLRRIYFQFLSKHEITEYPNLSENFLTQNFVDFGATDTLFSDLSHMPATSVERSLGFDPSFSSFVHAGQSHSSYHSFPELMDDFNRLSRTVPYIQDASGHLGDKTNGERSEVDSATRRLPGAYTILDDPTQLRDLSELRLAELALESGLPNEVDVALNSLLALSVTPSTMGASTSIRLAHCSNLLSLILATVGIFDDSSSSFVICDPVWRRQTQLNFLKFWHHMVRDDRGRMFLRPDVFINADFDNDDIDMPQNGITRSSFVELFAPSNCSTVYLAGDRVSDVHEDVETARALLVATILVNLVTPSPTPTGVDNEDDDDDSDYDAVITRTLSPSSRGLASAWRENARYLASCPTALRFAFLAAHAHHSGLRQLGLQLLSSLRYPLDPPPQPITSLDCPLEWTPLIDRGCRLGDLTLAFLVRSILECDDRAGLIAGLTFLSNLAKVPEKANETSLLNGLPAAVWPRLAQLICLPDLAVVCAGLEALRCLTNLGHFTCLFGWHACLENDLLDPSGLPLSLLQPLLSLLTLEGQAMGSQSLHRIKLMQRRPQPVPINSHAHPRLPPPHLSRSHLVRPEWPPQAQLHRIAPALPLPYAPQLPRFVPQPMPVHPKNEHVPSVTTSYVPSAFSAPPPPNRLPSPVIADVTAAANRPTGPIYRPPSGSTSCTGLINLLASSTSPSPCTVPGNSPLSTLTTTTPMPSTVTTIISPTPPVPVPSTPVLPTDTSTKPTTPSLSELTDRLQMPPPSLPPPSALRRSAKSGQSRSSIIGSPSTALRSKSTSLGSGTPVSSPTSVGSSMPSESPSSMGDSMESLDSTASSNSHTSRSTVLSERPTHSSNPDDVDDGEDDVKCETIVDSTSLANQSSRSATKSLKFTSSSVMNGIPNHTPSITSSPTVVPTKQSKVEDSPLKPLVNGELKANMTDDPELDLAPRLKTEHQRDFACGSPINGLKPGILQAAMQVLENQNMNDLQLTVRSTKHEDFRSIVMNGTMGSPLTSEQVNKSKSSNKLADLSMPSVGFAENPPNQNQLGLNGLKKSASNNTSNDCDHPSNIDPDTKRCNSEPVCLSANVEAVNGRFENNNSSSGSETESSPETQTRNSQSSRYLLKRRRRWGSRSRLFTVKRRREHTQTTGAAGLPNCGSSVKSKLTTSPLKPLPLQADPLPDSVLGPGWQPGWRPPCSSATECLSETAPFRSVQNCALTDSQRIQYGTESKHQDRLELNHEVGQPFNSTTSAAVPTKPTYLCEWESCIASFEDKNQVSSHVYLTHLATKQSESTPSPLTAYIHPSVPVRRCCRWRGCPSASLARAPFALLTHVLDVHCSSAELDAQYRYHSKTVTTDSRSTTIPTNTLSPVPSSSSSSLCDLQNLCSTVPMDVSSSPSGDPSAWSIVRSLEAKQMQFDLWAAQHHFISANPHSRIPLSILGPNPQPPMIAPPPREGPVTKHLRVSAALVIRNLVTYVKEARHWLLSELPLLSEVVMGCSPSDGGLRTNDASRIIAQCLSICTRTQKWTEPVGPFLPRGPLSSDYLLPRGLLLPPIPRGSSSSHARHRRHHHHHHGSSSSAVPRPPVFNVDLDARTT